MSPRSACVALALAAAAGASLPAAARAQAPAAGAACPAVAGRTAVPAPSTTLGRPLSSRPASPDDTVRVLRAIAAASPRVTVADAGRSGEGRPLTYAIVGDPTALSPDRRALVQRRVRAIRSGAVGPVATARAADGPAIVWLGGGVHANEPSGTTALLDAVHRLATDDGCATRRILRNVLTVVMPDQNPDGHARGTRTDGSGFDLNRDWLVAVRPESRARQDLLRRYPPVVAIDLHEQTGRDYFTPPYEAPIVAGLPRATRRFADATVAPAVGDALRRTGTVVTTGDGYDLLYPGYADSATSLLLGSGGMTFEQGSDASLATKTARHRTAALTALDAVARQPSAAIRAWAAGFRTAVTAGARDRTATGERVSAWVLRTERRAADARVLAQRLRDVDVEVRQLGRAVTVDRYRPVGSGAERRERLPAGTLVIPADQPVQRWADVVLGRQPEPGQTADTWSLPRLFAVTAGIAASPIPRSATRPFRPPPAGREGAGQRFLFPGDSAAAAGATTRLLAAGVPVGLLADGRFAAPATADAARVIQQAQVDVRRTPDGDPAAVPLRTPNVVVAADDGPPQVGPPALLPGTTGDQPSGWIPASLRPAGVATVTQSARHLAMGVRPGTTHVVVGPGLVDATDQTPALAASLRRFVAAGGQLLAVGTEGHRTLVALGLSAVRSSPPARLRAAATVAADPVGTVAGRALGGRTRVVVDGEDRISAPGSASTILQTPSASAFGPAGTALAIAEPVGDGRIVTLGFSPVFRGQSEGGLRVLLGLLLG